MNFWTRFFNINKRESTVKNAAPTPSPRTGYSYNDLFGDGVASSAMSVATVYRCAGLLGDSVANLPMRYMRLKGDIFVEDTASRLHYLLTVQPDYAKNAFDFWREIILEKLFEGNAYVVPVYNPLTLELDRLVLCGRGTVSHDIYNDTYLVNDLTNGISGLYHENEVIHIKGNSLDGKHGLSILSYARLTLSIATAGDIETRNRFINGGNVRGLVTNGNSVTGFGEYQDEQLKKLASSLDDEFQGGNRIVALPGQAGFSQLSLSSTDMQFLESRKFTVREICRFFGVHPSFVFDDTSNNYKSAEMANVAFLSNTLNPMLREIENEFHRKLVPPSLCCKRRFEFDRRQLYACDLESKVNYQTKTIAAGLYTPNEWRHEENKPPVEGGDTVLVSTNLRNIADNSTAITPQQEPTGPEKKKEQNEE